jgi:phosphatidate cytidylyltransferase
MMSNLATRVITAVVLIAVILVALFVLPSPAALVLVGAFFLVAAWEWSGFISGGTLALRLAYVSLVIVLAAIPFVIPASESELPKVLMAAICYWVLVYISIAFKIRIAGAWWTAACGLFALLPAWYGFTLFSNISNGYWSFLACVLLVAAADIGAYLTGKQFGRRKLAPQISPGKTWEGFAGGMFCGAASLVLMASVYTNEFAYEFVLPGLIFAGVSVLGDLWVSSFKRVAGLKDSGTLLPGHGGVLDRIDGLIAVLPIFALFFARPL